MKKVVLNAAVMLVLVNAVFFFGYWYTEKIIHFNLLLNAAAPILCAVTLWLEERRAAGLRKKLSFDSVEG